MNKDICVGDVILYKGNRYAVVDVEHSTCSLDLPYDKYYLICSEEFINSVEKAVTRDEILMHGKLVTMHDIKLNATIAEDASAYKVRSEKAYSFEQKN